MTLREGRARIKSSVSLPVAWITELKRFADAHSTTYSEVIQRAIEEFAEKREDIDLMSIRF